MNKPVHTCKCGCVIHSTGDIEYVCDNIDPDKCQAVAWGIWKEWFEFELPEGILVDDWTTVIQDWVLDFSAEVAAENYVEQSRS